MEALGTPGLPGKKRSRQQQAQQGRKEHMVEGRWGAGRKVLQASAGGLRGWGEGEEDPVERERGRWGMAGGLRRECVSRRWGKTKASVTHD